jgi:putative FmdB family regulatory protein
MPTYEYICDTCGHAFERFQSMSDEPVKKCPECAKNVRRLIGSGGGIIFKGSGFYHTDYKNPAQKAESNCPKKEDKSAKCGESSCCPNKK